MTTRDTSIEVYRQVEAEGILSAKRFDVYRVLFKHGPLTAAECWSVLGGSRVSISPRFAELQRWGAIRETGTRRCTVTGYQAITWDVTAKLPAKPDDGPTKAETELQRLRGRVAELEEENTRLRMPVKCGEGPLCLCSCHDR